MIYKRAFGKFETVYPGPWTRRYRTPCTSWTPWGSRTSCSNEETIWQVLRCPWILFLAAQGCIVEQGVKEAIVRIVIMLPGCWLLRYRIVINIYLSKSTKNKRHIRKFFYIIQFWSLLRNFWCNFKYPLFKQLHFSIVSDGWIRWILVWEKSQLEVNNLRVDSFLLRLRHVTL